MWQREVCSPIDNIDWGVGGEIVDDTDTAAAVSAAIKDDDVSVNEFHFFSFNSSLWDGESESCICQALVLIPGPGQYSLRDTYLTGPLPRVF